MAAESLRTDATLSLALVACACLFPSAAAARPASDASEIIKRSVVVNSADWNAQPAFSHRARYRKCKIEADGKVTVEQTKIYETVMIAGSPYERVLAIDNQPLTGVQQRQERLKMEREIARRANETPAERTARISRYENARAEEHMLMQQMTAAFNFTLTGEQQVEGVDCYVLNAVPNPAYQPPVEKARVLAGMRGRLWIDKEHFHWVRVQAEVANPVQFGMFVAKVKPGTRFELEQTPVGNVWLPKHFSESVNASVFGFYSLRSSEDEEYLDYRSALLDAKAAANPSHPAASSAQIAAR